jgi:hypothetical protein
MSSWGADIAQYKASKGRVPWKAEQQKPVIVISKYQKSREERAYDPIQGRFRDQGLEKQYSVEEREVNRTNLEKAKETANQYNQTFNIVNHKPNIKGSKLKRGIAEAKSGGKSKSNIPATRVGYNIISNKGFSKHHHAPPGKRPTEGESARAAVHDAPGTQKLDFDIISNKYSTEHDSKEALDKLASQQLAAQRYWKTHNFNPVEGTFYDPGKEQQFQGMLRNSEKVQGKEQLARQPRSITFSEGAMYDVISNAPKDASKLREASAIGDRSLKSKKRYAIEANKRNQSLHNEALSAERTKNRMNATKLNNSVSGFNPVTNQSTAQSSFRENGGSAWDRLAR